MVLPKTPGRDIVGSHSDLSTRRLYQDPDDVIINRKRSKSKVVKRDENKRKIDISGRSRDSRP